MYRVLYISVLFLFVYQAAQSQFNLAFSQISSKDGLSDNRVRDIVQLQDGRMIVCTVGITNIFDGTSFKQLHEQSEHVGSRIGNSYYNQTYIDRHYLWIKTKLQIRLIDLNKESFVSNPDSVLRRWGNGEPIVEFFLDLNHNYWMVTSSDKLLFKPANSSKVIIYKEHISFANNKKDVLINVAVIGKEVFLFYKSGLISCYDFKTRVLNYHTSLLNKEDLEQYGTSLKIVQTGDTLFTLHSGKSGILKRYITSLREWTTILKTDNGLRNLSIDCEKNLWLTSREGLWKIYKDIDSIQLIKNYRLVDGSIISTDAFALCNDKQGGLWIGTLNHGLLYYHPDRFKFRLYGKTYFISQEKDIDVNCFLDISLNKTLVGTSSGLYIFDKESNKLTSFKGLPIGISCIELISDKKNNIWLTSKNKGLYKIHKSKVEFATPNNTPIRRINVLDNRLLMTTSNSDAWILNQNNNSFKPLKFKSEIRLPESVSQIISFNDSSLLGISTDKVFLIDYKINMITYLLDSLLKNNIKPHTCCTKDSRGLVWIGTMDGLYVWNIGKNKIYKFYSDKGLVNNHIKGILEDNFGIVWVTTAGGISRIKVSCIDSEFKFGISNFNHFDGIIHNEFIAQSVYKSSDNLLFFGGINGFNVLDLNRSWGVRQLSRPLFTNLSLSGIPVMIGEKYNNRIVLNQSISTTDTLRLKYNQNFIGIGFTALNYINPSQTYYRYRLVGNNNQWNEISASNGSGQINFTNLEPGTYKLQVKAANSSKEWSNNFAQLTVIIQPPFWKTTGAYILYSFLVIIILYSIIASYKRRTHERLMRKNEEKLNQMKFEFFTNISHEFRTPLTLIITPLESILKETGGTIFENKIRIVWQHAKDLLELVNQLLDFRRLEIVGEQLNLAFGNITVFVGQFKELFEKIGEDKKIQFKVCVPDQDIWMYFDQSKLYRIINNLLSNAFKFTPKGGKVVVSLYKNDDSIILEVTDNGIGIPKNKLSKIFDSFYQAHEQQSQNGSGIGLHIVHKYVKLHSGEITAESEPEIKTVFRIVLPTTLNPINPDTTLENSIFPKNSEKINKEEKARSHQYKILIVEDNSEMRRFICSELKQTYLVLEAENGVEGVNIATTVLPDIIISDIMMPEMDGHELCKTIRSSINTSHIPIILLTAKNSEEHKFEGFKSGADEYLSKPFNLEFLKLRIKQLIDQQNNRKKNFINKIDINPSEITISTLDERFLEKALSCVESNISNVEYSVAEMSRDMHMDRTVLYRKLNGITGLTPKEFIRSVRIKRAAQILTHGKYPVPEVALMVGFNTPKYFSKYFKDAFGVLPSKYIQNQKNGSE